MMKYCVENKYIEHYLTHWIFIEQNPYWAQIHSIVCYCHMMLLLMTAGEGYNHKYYLKCVLPVRFNYIFLIQIFFWIRKFVCNLKYIEQYLAHWIFIKLITYWAKIHSIIFYCLMMDCFWWQRRRGDNQESFLKFILPVRFTYVFFFKYSSKYRYLWAMWKPQWIKIHSS